MPARLPRRAILAAVLAAGAASAFPLAALAATRPEIDRDVSAALKRLRAQGPKTRALLKKSVGVLIFPNITAGALVVGGQYGEGALRVAGKTTGYYSIAAASFGLQVGGETFSYALLFMNKSALDYLRKSDGWSIGSGPSVVVMDKGAATDLDTTNVTQDVVAIPYGLHGLMASASIQGSKITPITPSA
ncbi:MAG TPA: lipid-binding SYLF domain-containing protein [Stellaceae bacterium]|nr:lipid-binding SYLF domain-containing protein [Stellaceae bacterium]